MKIREKIKGAAVFLGGIVWVVFVVGFDCLMNKPAILGTKAVIGLGLGIIMVINGIRIYFRK
ncbi:MAG: hypothetical protein A2216_01490 [Omnitrophica WOR_2 bacterium RIFOXYA2_FULL_45_12]|nr:MAG: hypothetical protein A2216_01490 [Omnitrophica WOR_2 bacterium RIFOXYA2_FULL_45_12]